MTSSKRLAWVDLAKGMSMILVVMMYAAYNTGTHTGSVGFLHYVIALSNAGILPHFRPVSFDRDCTSLAAIL